MKNFGLRILGLFDAGEVECEGAIVLNFERNDD
jgi:hypothetical protein